MISVSPSQGTGFLLAIALSVLIHLALLFTPMIELAPTEVPMPALSAKLEPLAPLPAAKLPPASKPKAAPHKKVAPPPPPVAEHGSKAPEPAPELASSETPSAATSGIGAAAEPAPPEVATAPPASAHPLPKHAELHYTVFKAGTSFAIGAAEHRLDIDADQHYTLRTRANTTGLVRLLKRFELVQTSTGTITPDGLRPDKFVEDKVTSDGTDTHVADFDWAAGSLNFSTGNHALLKPGTQDIVSLMYQLSQLSWNGNPIALAISNGKKLEHYQLEVGEETTLDTPMGKLRAIPMRKVRAPNEEGLEIWLAVEYRLLPVKITQLERDGSVAGEMRIAEILVSD